ncbi:hypothetical protein [Pseudoduganella umbonata]|uniref:Uncharacterized protein n=1 Tax=Pseudoduganella umbonata TaxID=864828 RepID=A0A4P8HSW7_9BURK|nr:hypothetical protein [Pseudoduganella umbonata]MBB3222107.1 hypothetical protein [Pseudoduganella umbonata]QCP12346.1 hypothetical protein FCL38_19410 [Pseudoduganella umbonata]
MQKIILTRRTKSDVSRPFDNEVRIIRKPGAVVAFDTSKSIYARMLADFLVPTRPSYRGPAAKENVKPAANAGVSCDNGDASGGGSDDGGDDGDGDDGDGDSDGPRPSTPSLRPRSPSSRANRRKPSLRSRTPSNYWWLLLFASILAYCASPTFSLLCAELGHADLAKEMLRFRPVLLMPIPAGWSTSL